ncbi:hypothetical protein GF357_05280 [Candidatus Dojkabacteria bacterium]|nr:hypothetical protein [Candidatus Dojkabacteria bacterium]
MRFIDKNEKIFNNEIIEAKEVKFIIKLFTMKVKSIIKTVGILGALEMALVRVALADPPNKYLTNFDYGPENSNLIGFVISTIQFAVGLTGIGAVVMLIVGGVQYITAGGDEGKVEAATKTITNALIGLAIVITSLMIVTFVSNKIDQLGENAPTV